MEQIIATVGVVVFKKNDPESVCLVEHTVSAGHMTGSYGLPSGKIEPHESSVDAAVREMREESGLISAPECMVFVKQYHADIEQKDGVKRFSWDVYRCQDYSGDLKASDETRPLWVRKNDFSKIAHFLPNVLDAIEQANHCRT